MEEATNTYRSLKGGDRTENLGLHWIITLNLIVKISVCDWWFGACGSGEGGNELSVFHKRRHLLD